MKNIITLETLSINCTNLSLHFLIRFDEIFDTLPSSKIVNNLCTSYEIDNIFRKIKFQHTG